MVATANNQTDEFPRLQEIDDRPGLPFDRNRVLLELGVCQWSGTLAPFRGHIQAPAPSQLAEFVEGGRNWYDAVSAEDLPRVSQQIVAVAQGRQATSLE